MSGAVRVPGTPPPRRLPARRERITRYDGTVVNIDQLAEQVLQLLVTAARPMAGWEVRAALGYSDDAVRAALARLFSRNRVARVGTGSRNWKYKVPEVNG